MLKNYVTPSQKTPPHSSVPLVSKILNNMLIYIFFFSSSSHAPLHSHSLPPLGWADTMRGFNIEIFPSSPKGLSIRGRHCDVAFMCGSRWRLLGVALPPALPGSHTLSLPDYRYLSKAKVRGIDPGIHLFTWEDRVFLEFVFFLLLFLRGLVCPGAFHGVNFGFRFFFLRFFLFSGWCDFLFFFLCLLLFC